MIWRSVSFGLTAIIYGCQLDNRNWKLNNQYSPPLLSLLPGFYSIWSQTFISPSCVYYVSILCSSGTAASQTNTLSIPSTTLIPAPANKTLLILGTALISTLLSHTQAEPSSHRPSLQTRDIVACNNSLTWDQSAPWGSCCFVLPRAANACALAPLSALQHFHVFACLSDSFHVAFPLLCTVARFLQLSIFRAVCTLDLALRLRCYRVAKCDTFSRLASR